MASTKTVLKIYDKLDAIKKRGVKSRSAAHILKDAIELSTPVFTEFVGAASALVAKIGHVPIEEVRDELKRLLKTYWEKLVIAKLAMTDAMDTAKLSHRLLDSTFTPDRFEIAKMFTDGMILLKCGKQVCDVLLIRLESNHASLQTLGRIARGLKDEEELRSVKTTEFIESKLIGLSTSGISKKSVQRKEIIISILQGLEPSAAMMAKEIVCQLPKPLRVVEATLRRHELSELSKDGVISNTPGQGYHLKSRS